MKTMEIRINIIADTMDTYDFIKDYVGIIEEKDWTENGDVTLVVDADAYAEAYAEEEDWED